MNDKKKKPASRVQDKIRSNDPLAYHYQMESLKWILTLSCSIAVFIGVAEFIVSVYHPDIQKALNRAFEISVATTGFAPEPTEKLLFMVGVAVFVVAITGFYFLPGTLLKRISKKTIQSLYLPALIIGALAVLFITYRGLIAPNPFASNIQSLQDINTHTNYDFYFINTFLYKNLYISLLLIFPVVLINFFYKYNYKAKSLQYIDKAKGIVVYSFCAILIVLVFFISAFKFPYTFENKYDFNAVYYAMVQVYNGFPLLVDNFTSTYGLYPHFLLPILKITGLSIQSFSDIMAFLSAVCFMSILLVLLKTVKSKLLILFGFSTIFFNCYIYFRINTSFDSVFSMVPIRWLLPTSLILYCTYYLGHRSQILYFLSFFLFSLGILWSPDFGVLTYLSLFIFYSFLELEKKNLKQIIFRTALHLFYAVAICCVTLFAYSLIIKIGYGSFPDLSKIFSTITIFSFIGFGMLPMPTGLHPWMIVALTYLTGLLYVLHDVINRKQSNRTGIVFLLTVIGIASFSYYQGRSHNWNLLVSNFEAFLLLTVFADDLLIVARRQKAFILPFSLLILFLFFSVFQTIYDYDRITKLLYEKENKAKSRNEQNKIIENANFIHGLTKEKEKILVYSAGHYQSLYHDLSKTCSALNPGMIDLFLKSDYKRMTDFIINNNDTKIFFEPEFFTFYNIEIPTILAGLYHVEKFPDNSTLMFLTKKKDSTDSSFILRQDKRDVLHEKIDASPTTKLAYMNGKKGNISLDKQFSIELIFRPDTVPNAELMKQATILCNDTAEKGFRLMQSDTSHSLFYFIVGNEGAYCPVVPGKWNYLAIEMNEKAIRVFSNGRFMNTVNVNNSYVNSDRSLFIANYHQEGAFFFGDIKEIRISNGPLDEKDVNSAESKVSVLQ